MYTSLHCSYPVAFSCANLFGFSLRLALFAQHIAYMCAQLNFSLSLHLFLGVILSMTFFQNAHDKEIQSCRQKAVTSAAAQQQQGQYCTREDGEAVHLRRHVNALARHLRHDRRKLKLAKFGRIRMVSMAAQLTEQLNRATGMKGNRNPKFFCANSRISEFYKPLVHPQCVWHPAGYGSTTCFHAGYVNQL